MNDHRKNTTTSYLLNITSIIICIGVVALIIACIWWRIDTSIKDSQRMDPEIQAAHHVIKYQQRQAELDQIQANQSYTNAKRNYYLDQKDQHEKIIHQKQKWLDQH